MVEDKGRKPGNPVGGGVCYDKHGHPIAIGDLYRAPDGRVYKAHGFTGERQPGTNAEYARDVEWMPPDTPWTDSARTKGDDDQSIIWGS